MSSGLTRYRSAPSSYFTNFFNSGDGDGDGDEAGGGDCNGFLNPGPSSPGTESFFGRFMSRVGADGSNSHNLGEIQNNSCQDEPVQSQYMASMMPETEVLHQQQQSNTYPSQMLYQSQSQSPLPNHNSAASGSSIDNSYRLGSSSMGMDCSPPMKIGGGNNSNLIRHSSSPAGLFANINVENGYGAMRGMENFGSSNCANAESTFSPARRVKGQIDFSTGPPSSSGLMNHISEIGSKSTGPDSPEDGSFSESRRNSRYISGFPSGSWDDSAILSDNFLQRLGDDDSNSFAGLNRSENQHGEGGNRSRPPTVLSHHLSLPKSSAELSSMEKLLQFQDSVPYKIRAKRGCATHPRSIAERERRSRISERMRKLQELVPNMDKQTNTADMLDLAVDYIKDLQKQVKALNDNRAKCTCSNRPNP